MAIPRKPSTTATWRAAPPGVRPATAAGLARGGVGAGADTAPPTGASTGAAESPDSVDMFRCPVKRGVDPRVRVRLGRRVSLRRNDARLIGVGVDSRLRVD